MKRFVTFLLSFCTLLLIGQTPTPFASRVKSDVVKSQESNDFAHIPFKNIGPTVFSGRVSDIEVNPKDPSKFFVSYASGGLWYTDNNGTSFESTFDHEDVMTIGDFDVNWADSTIWVGTGEVNSSRSSYAGLGMYVSYDFGESWERKGLEETHHIGKVLIDPEDPQHILVAALGHLYSANKERGIYQSVDGGTSWQQQLFINDNTGAVDMIRDPNDTDILYAATWHRERRAWNFVESGEGSGIYKSSDGGDTWTIINNGFPQGDGVGRIGLSMGTVNGTSRIYALLDNYDRRAPEEKKEDEGLTKNDFKEMTDEEFKNLKKEDLKSYLSENRFPKKYTTEKVMSLFNDGKIKPSDLASYLENANSLLFDTPVIGAELYASDDGGMSWSKTHDDYLDAVYNSYGYYFGVVRVNPSNLDEVYVLGVPIIRSDDGGQTFTNIGGDNVHSDHQALWVNPQRDGHIINGNDGGINISYDAGEHWSKCNSPSVGQFYQITVDMAEPYNVYGGLQDNGVWFGPSTNEPSTRWHSTGQYPFKSIMGGDGMYTQVDTRDNITAYTGFQFGNYFRVNTTTGSRKRITPSHELGDAPLRWNWLSPIHLSIHNPDIFYMGSNKLFRSFNQGDDFEAISDDLTAGGQTGDVAFGTLTSIHESPKKFGLLYTGSDDGLVHVSRNGGYQWDDISEGLPENLWVTRVQASAHEEGRVYLSLNGYRWDDFKPYVYKSDDYGATWIPIGLDLPNDPVNVIKEDPVNENILYVGTDFGSYVSVDQGAQFYKLSEGLPHVPVHDLVVHPREHDLLIATHGRSIYKGNIEMIREFDNIKEKSLYVSAINSPRSNQLAGRKRGFYESEGKDIEISLFAKEGGSAQIQVLNDNNTVLQTHNISLHSGFNVVMMDGTIHEKMLKSLGDSYKEPSESSDGLYYLPKGTYTLKVIQGGKNIEKEMVIE